MTWLLFLFSFTLGAEQTRLLEPTLAWYGFTDLEAAVLLFKTVEVGGGSTVYVQPALPPWFQPVEADFRAFVKLHLGNFDLVGEHQCNHNFDGFPSCRQPGYNRIYVTLSNRERP